MPARPITDPTLRMLWSSRRLFLGVMVPAFAILAAAIFAHTNHLAILRSAIDPGHSIVNRKQEAFEPSGPIAKEVSSVYVPAALAESKKSGASSWVLRSLETTTVENAGRALVLVSRIDTRAEKEAKVFQQGLADRIVSEQSRRTQVIRDVIAERLASASQRSINLWEQSESAKREIGRIDVLSRILEDQIEDARTVLARLSGARDEERAISLKDQISGKTTSLASLAIERAKLVQGVMTIHLQSDAMAEQISQAKNDRKMLGEPLIPPQITVSIDNTSRPLTLLIIAFTVSFLIAFGTVALLQRVTETRH